MYCRMFQAPPSRYKCVPACFLHVSRSLHRYQRGGYLLPASHGTTGPAIWRIDSCGSSGAEEELSAALLALLRYPLERRSRGVAATQAAAKLASSLVSTVWGVLDDVVVTPALQAYVNEAQGGQH